MLNYLPSLSALRAFEAAARHLSFTKAASELGVTQSAISRQMRSMEDLLGLRLFERTGSGLVLTRSGSRLRTQDSHETSGHRDRNAGIAGLSRPRGRVDHCLPAHAWRPLAGSAPDKVHDQAPGNPDPDHHQARAFRICRAGYRRRLPLWRKCLAQRPDRRTDARICRSHGPPLTT